MPLLEAQAVAEAKRCMSCGLCFECDNCVVYCPQTAVFKVKKTSPPPGRYVDTDYNKCIGCHICARTCAPPATSRWASRSFVHEPQTNQKADVPRGMGTVEACTLCVHRVDRGEMPACVSACAGAGHAAIVFGDLNDPQSDISQRIASYPTRQIRDNLNLDTGVRYLGL
jgi:tetrathionate reductase subunit B